MIRTLLLQVDKKAKEETLMAQSMQQNINAFTSFLASVQNISAFTSFLASVKFGQDESKSCAEICLSNAGFSRIFLARVSSPVASTRESAVSELMFLHGVEFSNDEVACMLLFETPPVKLATGGCGPTGVGKANALLFALCMLLCALHALV